MNTMTQLEKNMITVKKLKEELDKLPDTSTVLPYEGESAGIVITEIKNSSVIKKSFIECDSRHYEKTTGQVNPNSQKEVGPEYVPIFTEPTGDCNTDSYNVGESDYSSMDLQPWEIWERTLMDPFRADIVKRLMRSKSSDSPVLDMQKIKHICDKIIELYETTDYYKNFPSHK